MKKYKIKTSRVASILLVVLMMLGLYTPMHVNAETYTITSSKIINLAEGSAQAVFTTTGDIQGVCCEPANQKISGVGVSVSVSEQSSTSQIAKAVYLGYTKYDGNIAKYVIGRAVAYIKGNVSFNNYIYKAEVNGLVEDSKGTVKIPSNFKVYICNPNDGGQDFVGWKIEPNVRFSLTKLSSLPEITSSNKSYSLADAEYDVFDADDIKVGSLITKTDGTTNILSLPMGKYKVVETKAPKGYALDKTPKYFDLDKEENKGTVSDIPTTDSVGIVLKKLDKETRNDSSLGNGSLKGAVYTISYYDGQHSTVEAAEASGKPTRVWEYKTNEKGLIDFQDPTLKISGDNYYNSNGVPVIPLGTVIIKEKNAPKGYLIDTKAYLVNIKEDGKHLSYVQSFNESIESLEQVQRGDIKFVKIADTTSKRLSNVPFRITSITTGESHIVVTDPNGEVNTSSSWVKHSTNTNGGTSFEDGVWFGTDEKGNKAPVDDKLGALPYDTYVMEELPCKENEGFELAKDITFTVYRDLTSYPYPIDLGTITNDELAPEIGTMAKDSETNSHYSNPDNKVTVIDTVEYKNLTVGKIYTVSGTLMNKETGEPILVNGKKVTATKEFKASSKFGAVDVEFYFDGSTLAGETIVVFEQMSLKGNLVASHEDIKDTDQTIYLPKIETSAKDCENGGKVLKTNTDVSIIDTVNYSNLEPGEEYKMVGVLMDKSTGKELLINGERVTTNTIFIADESGSGTVEMKFSFNSSQLAGKETVVFERVFDREGIEVAHHTDINDLNQTVAFEEIKTYTEESKLDNNLAASKDDIVKTNVLISEKVDTGDKAKMTPYVLIILLGAGSVAGISLKLGKKE